MEQQAAHSPIGASSYYRWKRCPGSARLAQAMTKFSTGFADEGTDAHDLAYRILVSKRDKKPMPDMFEVDDDTLEHVMLFVDHMIALQRKGSIQKYEHRFHLKKIHPLCYGTCDGVTYYPDEQLLIISDYKHGAGIFVDATKNDQLMYYALGAVLTMGVAVKKIRIEIIQPRITYAEAIRPWELDIFDIWEFADQLREDAKATEDPDAPLCAGDWCTMCPVAPTCPLLRIGAKVLLTREQKNEGLDDVKTVAAELEWIPILEAAFKRKREYAYAKAEKGEKIPGWKLVEKIGRRKWKDPALAVDELHLAGFDKLALYTKPIPAELISPSKVESLTLKQTPFKKKKDLKEFVATLVTPPISSGHKLVPEDHAGVEVVKVKASTVFASLREEIDALT